MEMSSRLNKYFFFLREFLFNKLSILSRLLLLLLFLLINLNYLKLNKLFIQIIILNYTFIKRFFFEYQ